MSASSMWSEWVPASDGFHYVRYAYNTSGTQPMEDGGMKVYEYLVVYTGEEDYVGAKVLAGPTISLGADEDVVKMEAARAIPAEYADKLDDIDIHVREWA